MANLVFNISLGKVRDFTELDEGANDALVLVFIETTGIEADATLRDHDNLSVLLAGSSNEQTNQARKTITASITVDVDDTNNWVDVDVPDQTWVALNGNAISALLFCYDNDTTAGDDTNIVPLTKHDFVVDPDGTDVTAVINAEGFFRATG